jgi:hypothetical protein
MIDGMTPAAQGRPEEEQFQPRLELEDAAEEILAIVRYLTGEDGPLGAVADDGSLSRWHERLLMKAQERLVELDTFLRGRVAFFTAAPSQGYGNFDRELALAGASLDTCRALTSVIDGLLAGHLPSEERYEAVGHTALLIYPALAWLNQ